MLKRAAISRSDTPDLRRFTSSAISIFFRIHRSQKWRTTVGGRGSLVPGQRPPLSLVKSHPGLVRESVDPLGTDPYLELAEFFLGGSDSASGFQIKERQRRKFLEPDSGLIEIRNQGVAGIFSFRVRVQPIEIFG